MRATFTIPALRKSFSAPALPHPTPGLHADPHPWEADPRKALAGEDCSRGVKAWPPLPVPPHSRVLTPFTAGPLGVSALSGAWSPSSLWASVVTAGLGATLGDFSIYSGSIYPVLGSARGPLIKSCHGDHQGGLWFLPNPGRHTPGVLFNQCILKHILQI